MENEIFTLKHEDFRNCPNQHPLINRNIVYHKNSFYGIEENDIGTIVEVSYFKIDKNEIPIFRTIHHNTNELFYHGANIDNFAFKLK